MIGLSALAALELDRYFRAKVRSFRTMCNSNCPTQPCKYCERKQMFYVRHPKNNSITVHESLNKAINLARNYLGIGQHLDITSVEIGTLTSVYHLRRTTPATELVMVADHLSGK